MAGAPAWSSPDAAGVRSLVSPGRSALKGRRLRRADRADDLAPAAWPQDWRGLLIDWMRASSSSRVRWATLELRAADGRMGLALQLQQALLESGWIELEELRSSSGRWDAVWLRWLDRAGLSTLIGLPDAEALRAQATVLAEEDFEDARIPALVDALQGRSPVLRLRRIILLRALDRWLSAQRAGSRRQFAYFACGDTKGIPDSDWVWLDEALGLGTLGIGEHVQGLWMRAPLGLRVGGRVLELGAVPDAIALTPATLAAIDAVDGHVERWRIVENRTSFEQAALSLGARDGVLWVPGFASQWWLKAALELIVRAPAPVRVACDPDPAGIRIALLVGQACARRGIEWRPWRMRGIDLETLGQHKSLGDYDRAELSRLAASADAVKHFESLMDAMHRHGRKGEQEGLDFSR